jgi:hypothetical protein
MAETETMKKKLYDEDDLTQDPKMAAMWSLLGVGMPETESKHNDAPEGVRKSAPVQHTAPVKESAPVKDTAPLAGAENCTGAEKRTGAPAESRTGAENRTSQPMQETAPVRKSAPVNDAAPVQYNAPADDAATDAVRTLKNWAQFGFLAFLRMTLPPDGGLLRVGELSRDTGMCVRQIQTHLAALESAGFIETVSKGQDGRGVVFRTGAESLTTRSCCCILDSKESKETTTTDNEVYRTGEGKRTDAESRTGYRHIIDASKRALVFFAMLTARKQPETLSGTAVSRLVGFIEDTSDENAVAMILECAPRARDNISAYLIGAVEKGASPSVASVERAKNVIECARKVRERIQDTILWRDWIKAAETFGIRIPKLSEEGAEAAQAQLLERLARFTG